MKYVEIIADPGSLDTLKAIAGKTRAADLRTAPPGEDGMQQTRMLVADDRLQPLLDALQNVLGAQHTARISVLPIEVALPEPPEKEEREEDKATEAREKLRSSVEKGARLNLNHIVLVVLSTLVAAIGLLEDSVAVVIGAMVIAPLLGPNLAFALGTALGDLRLAREGTRPARHDDLHRRLGADAGAARRRHLPAPRAARLNAGESDCPHWN